MSNADRLAATFLFYLKSGLDAGKASKEEGSIGFRSPSQADLEAVMHKTPIAIWRGVYPTAEAMVADIVASEPRDVMTVVREVGGLIKRGQDAIEKVAGPMSMAEVAAVLDEKSRKGKRR
jgi:hypothetical protein